MNKQTIDLIDNIYTAMLTKISRRLFEKRVPIDVYCDCMNAAAEHVNLITDIFNCRDGLWLTMDFDIESKELWCEMQYIAQFLEDNISINDDNFLDFVAASFQLVGGDDLLFDVLGDEEYFNIIGEANKLVFEGMRLYENLSEEEYKKFTSDLYNILVRHAEFDK